MPATSEYEDLSFDSRTPGSQTPDQGSAPIERLFDASESGFPEDLSAALDAIHADAAEDTDSNSAPGALPPLDLPPLKSRMSRSAADRGDYDQNAADEGSNTLQLVMEETIAQLQSALEQREQELLQSTIAAANFHQELQATKTRNEHLKKRLTEVVRSHEALSQRAAAMEQAPATQGRTLSEAEVAQMKEQWRVAQKSFEREYGRVKSELAKTKAGAHQIQQELETQTHARRAEAAHASLRIANLQEELDGARTMVAEARQAPAEGHIWLKLSITAVVTAFLMLGLGLWWQSSHGAAEPTVAGDVPASGVRPSPPPVGQPPAALPMVQPAGVPPAGAAAPAAPIAAAIVPASAQGKPASTGIIGNGIGSRGAFQKALSRLNNVLYGPVGVTPEQVLRAVRESNAKTNPNVCNFQWNGGQPSLMYGGVQTTLEYSLDQCATAVESFLRQPDARGAIAKK